MTDGVSYNYNGRPIPSNALETIHKRLSGDSENDVDISSGLVYVSERKGNLETLYIALHYNNSDYPEVETIDFAHEFGTFDGIRMEDSGCIAGDYLVYVTTKDNPHKRRFPWTSVYKTNLKTSETQRLTPQGKADLSPSVSPSGKKIAVASFKEQGWEGEIEDLKTDIYVFNVDGPDLDRKMVIKNGGWPTWGSENILFFHRKVGDYWGVFRADISNGFTSDTPRVTPEGFHAMTPAAIDETTVAVATIRKESKFDDTARSVEQYRHIEVFHFPATLNRDPIKITQRTRPKADHFNPFVIVDEGGDPNKIAIGYHRCKSDNLNVPDYNSMERKIIQLDCPPPNVDLFRVQGVFPSFSRDGSRLAFVDNEFMRVWVADKDGLYMVYQTEGPNNVFGPVWNQIDGRDELFVCKGPAFNVNHELDICRLPNIRHHHHFQSKDIIQLTNGNNNAFPSPSPDGKRFVFRSTRDGGESGYKNLYIMENSQVGESNNGKVTRLTNGAWTDTHCQWSPSGDWIVFSSTRDKPSNAPASDNGLDPGYFAVYLVNANTRVVIKVLGSGDDFVGHVNHPFFSPDGKRIVVTADLAAVSIDPISLPLFTHSVRPYGDIFIVEIDDILSNIDEKNRDDVKFVRVTHSRFENGAASWTKFSIGDPNESWKKYVEQYGEHSKGRQPSLCPIIRPRMVQKSLHHDDRGESWHLTGHLCIRDRLPLDIYSQYISNKNPHEVHMTDGVSYNYNGRPIPSNALQTIHKRLSGGSENDVDISSGLVYVSERKGNLETLYIALHYNNSDYPEVETIDFAHEFGTFDGIRMEDSGCIAGDYLVYVTTKDNPHKRRFPWTSVYKTNLKTSETQRLTPQGKADLSPSVSPSGKKIAVASFKEQGWEGEIEDLKTDIYVFNVDGPDLDRKMVIKNGGWPTWGSENILFFHRKVGDYWGVFRADISNGFTSDTPRVTPEGFHAMTPAAIDETTVAVATIRKESKFDDTARSVEQYRHIEVFHFPATLNRDPIKITQRTRPKADHFNPFVIVDEGGDPNKIAIGYHRCKSDNLNVPDYNSMERKIIQLDCPPPNVDLFRVQGVFPSFSRDGSRLAFVDNEFMRVWVADKDGLYMVYQTEGPNNVFGPVWNQIDGRDELFVCKGPAFNVNHELDICRLPNIRHHHHFQSKDIIQLTNGNNNAFPSPSPDGKRFVFRSTRDGGKSGYKNLYIMENSQVGESNNGKVTRLTNGAWTDTHCQWSPSGDWIVFSSTRDKPSNAPASDNGLDPGYFAVYLVNANTRVVIKVLGSGDDFVGHVNHPFFSPDGKRIVVTADLAAVSIDPISLPLFTHSVRPYGDIFIVEIDDILNNNDEKNRDDVKFVRVTHSRFENGAASWTKFSIGDPNESWKKYVEQYGEHSKGRQPSLCPIIRPLIAKPLGLDVIGESWHLTGHLCIRDRRC
ncbi:hypothetical protein G4B88_023485 [Cannabis sativa]|uniref:Uncharacterized protein n=1 Tax=Cannabis sativa TaxID=3483 RepID=A0A7J6HVM2_CANSA|nr:hypothetical protein G4B88_023485 [Cannabis sativa]